MNGAHTGGKPSVWFLTGSQHLYGPETLDQVADQSARIQRMLTASGGLSAEVVGQPVLTETADIRRVMLDANADPDCLGVIAWMHTFSRPRCGSPGWTPCASRCCTCTPS